MTFSVTDESAAENMGSQYKVRATVDITSLDSAGTEPFDPNEDLSDVDDYEEVVVVDQETYSRRVVFDHGNDQFHVVDISDGTDTANNTDVGTVDILVLGRR
jgi:hypothetical protein